MDDRGTTPSVRSANAQRLRDGAKRHLDEATLCNDLARRDVLLQQALDMLAEARRLQVLDSQATAHTGEPANSHLKGHP